MKSFLIVSIIKIFAIILSFLKINGAIINQIATFVNVKGSLCDFGYSYSPTGLQYDSTQNNIPIICSEEQHLLNITEFNYYSD